MALSSSVIAGFIREKKIELEKYNALKAIVSSLLSDVGEIHAYFSSAADEILTGLIVDGKPADSGKTEELAFEIQSVNSTFESALDEIRSKINILSVDIE